MQPLGWLLEEVQAKQLANVRIKVLGSTSWRNAWGDETTVNYVYVQGQRQKILTGYAIPRHESLKYHGEFAEAAFLLPLITPSKQPSYFNGNPSSGIAYAVHFGLRLIGHRAIGD